MLSTRKETLIKNTVARMPIHAVIPLLHEVGELAFHVPVIQTTFGLPFSWGKLWMGLSISVNKSSQIILI